MDIVVPANSNIPIMDWVVPDTLAQLMETGCRVYLSPPPFDHSKLLCIDGIWSLVGSTNWHQRSLRLNFEFNLECYGRAFNAQLVELVPAKIQGACRCEPDRIDARPWRTQVRDGTARLLSPYL